MTERLPSNIYPCLTYADAHAAIAWLCEVFGFEQRLLVPDDNGGVRHSELQLGEGVVMVSSPRPDEGRVALGPGAGYSLSVRIDDPDAHFARAKAAGAEIVRELTDEEYGARGYLVADLEGHRWYFADYSPGVWWS
ncbi:MAG: VOC family protein [Planctomycetota bacterium]|nr:VOC family protein [Planctomycetota bacterium]